MRQLVPLVESRQERFLSPFLCWPTVTLLEWQAILAASNLRIEPWGEANIKYRDKLQQAVGLLARASTLK